MSGLPPLPEGDDPFVLLGIGRDADELAVRRAYTRLIRTYRPDVDPNSFVRLRQAYEAACRDIGRRLYDDDEDAEREEEIVDGGAATPPAEAAVAGRLAAAWKSLAAGTEASTVLLRLQGASDDQRVALHRMLLTDAGGLDVHAELVSSLQRGLPLCGWVEEVLCSDELQALATHGSCTWTTLRKQPDIQRAAHLMQVRLNTLMMRGRLDQAAAEVLEERYAEDAASVSLLTWAGQEVLAVAAWDGWDRLERLDGLYGAGTASDHDLMSPQDHRAAAGAHREPWQSWCNSFRSARALRRFFVLGPIVHGSLLQELVDDLAAALLDRTPDHARFLDQLGALAPELLERFIVLAGMVRAGVGTTACALDDPGLAALDERLGEPALRRWKAEAAYGRLVRPALWRMAVTTGLSPEALARHLEDAPDTLSRLRTHVPSIRRDRTLAALEMCMRLAQPGAMELQDEA